MAPSINEIPGIFLEFLALLFKLVIYFLEAVFRLFVSPSRKDVSGKVVLVTGGGHGMGGGVAKQLAQLGARVVIWDINEAGNSRTAKDIQSGGGEVHAYTVDVSKKEKVYEAAARVKREVGRVDILINNAGTLVGELLLELTDSQIERVINVNLMSHFWTLRAFLPDMISSKEGHIVTMSSTSGYFGTNFLVDYTASKFAITGLEEALEIELMKNYDNPDIKLTIVHPFIIKTGFVHGWTSRFMAFIEEEDAVDAIVDGLLRNKRRIFIPSSLGMNVVVKYLLPHKSSLAFTEFLKVETTSQGKQD